MQEAPGLVYAFYSGCALGILQLPERRIFSPGREEGWEGFRAADQSNRESAEIDPLSMPSQTCNENDFADLPHFRSPVWSNDISKGPRGLGTVLGDQAMGWRGDGMGHPPEEGRRLCGPFSPPEPLKWEYKYANSSNITVATCNWTLRRHGNWVY